MNISSAAPVQNAAIAAPHSEFHSPNPVPRAHSPAGDFAVLDSAMRGHIEAALRRTRGRIEGPRGAAKLLGVNPHTLRARMRKLQIEWRTFRPVEDAI